MRMLTALFLSLVLAVASVSMAVARGQAPMAGTIELCTEDGVVSVVLDAKGNPVAPHVHLCPDCLSAATAFDLPVPVNLPAPVNTARALRFAHLALILAGSRPVAPHARGPPAPSV